MVKRNDPGERDVRWTRRSGRMKREARRLRPDSEPISTVLETSRIVGLVSENRLPKLGWISTSTDVTEPEPARRVRANEHDCSESASELSFSVRVGSQGARRLRAVARGKPAIVGLQRVLIVLTLMAGTVGIVRSLRTLPDPWGPKVLPCSEPPRARASHCVFGAECRRDAMRPRQPGSIAPRACAAICRPPLGLARRRASYSSSRRVRIRITTDFEVGVREPSAKLSSGISGLASGK